MNKLCHRLWLGMLLLGVSMLTAHAQSASPDQEYQKLIQVDQNIQPLGEHPFGENISLYDGSVSFNVTDVSLRGNGPTITVGRTGEFFEWMFESSNGSIVEPQLPFDNWELDIPRIETLVATQLGWQTGLGGTTPTASTTSRCSKFASPPGIASTTSEGGWVPDEWWYGYNLFVPGEGKQLLLPRSASNLLSPTISGMSFSIVTKNNWMVGCGVTASDGGEGFLAIAPDGTRYTFAHLVYRPWYRILGAGPLTPDGVHVVTSNALSAQGAKPMVGGPGGIGWLEREDAFMYVTQIQDRFGNALTYHYDPSTGYLSSITANDGREVDITYTKPGSWVIQTITAKAANAVSRTWTYTYAAGLTGVQLPDGSAWSYNLHVGPGSYNTSNSNCQLNQLPYYTYPVTADPGSDTITTPSGLTGTFRFGSKLSGRSYTPKYCYGSDNGTFPSALYPEWSIQPAITSEVLSGAGMPTETWNYSYSPANESWSYDSYAPTCATSGTCATTVYTDVTDPNGNDTRYTFSNRFDATEGLLQETDYYSGSASGTLMRSEINTYANPTGGPWPATYGSDLLYRDNQLQVTELSPLQQRDTVQDGGDRYRWHAVSFNSYAQPIDVQRYNSIAGQNGIEETTSYLNDPALWVLGLPEVMTNTTNGASEVESVNTYNPSNDTLLSRSRFGQTLMRYTFNNAGQLATFTDGDNNTTTIGSYYRGIPQAIAYQDGTNESLVVDDFGQIKQMTDQAGHTTQYNYDAVGRVNGVIYPSGDTVAWYPKSITYNFVTSAERGIPANHWRRTETTQSDNKVTYFDAMLRPLLTDDSTGVAGSDISTVNSYDFKGNKLFESYPTYDGTTAWNQFVTGVHHTYDALEREIQTQQDAENSTALTTRTVYLSGAGTQVTDPKKNVTTTYYQMFDEPSYSAPIQVQTPEGITQAVARDIYGNPSTIMQSGSYNGALSSITKSLFYDTAHRLCRTMEPESGSSLMTYDGANNVQTTATGMTITEAGCGYDQVPSQAVTTYTYYPMNRVHTIAPPAGTQSTSYTYDALGRVQTSISGAAIQGYSYNSLGLLTNESLWLPSAGYVWSLAYGYDGYGHLNNVTYPNGESVGYLPDARGRPTQAGSYVSNVKTFPNGDLSNFTYGNGAAYVAAQNTRQLLGNFAYGTTSAVNLSEDLLYDANGNITNVNDLANGPRTKAFTYDGLNRLKTAQASALSINESYTYDALNNLRTRLTGGVTFNLNYDGNNRLQTLTTGAGTFASYGYDSYGNRQTVQSGSSTSSYLFDAKNQLTQLVGVDNYAYDALGKRTTKTPAGGSPTYSFYSQAGQLMYQLALGQSQSTNYIYLGKKMVARSSSVQLGTPGAITFNPNPNNGSYTVSWGTVTAATSYLLQEQFNGGAWTQVYQGANASAPFSGRNGGGYTYQVQACASGACGPFRVSTTLGVTPALPVVTVPTNGLSGAYTVSWSTPIGATSYNVQESFDGGAWTTVASGTTATSISRPGTANGTYAYQVTAINLYGNRGPATSATVTVISLPGAISFSQNPSSGNYTVSWGSVTAATSYVLQESYAAGAWTQVYQGSNTSAPFTNKDGGTYVYRVQACINSVCGAFTTSSNLGVTPRPPTLTVPSGVVGANYTISWNAPLSATSYIVQESLNGGCIPAATVNPIICQGAWTTIGNGITATSIARSNTTAGTYSYQVAATNIYGTGNWSAVATVSVTQVPATPTNFTGTIDGNGQLILTWDAMPFATSYDLVEYGTNGSLGEFYFYPSSNTFSMPAPPQGHYSITVASCSAAGCSATAQVGGTNKFGLDSKSESTMTYWINKAERALDTGTNTASGCTTTSCTIVTGSSP